jgi:hypothetical protein
MADETTNLQSKWRRRGAAAQYVREKHGQPCETYATRGGGPKFHKVGSAVLYHEDDLDEWALNRISPAVRTTSEYRRAQPWQPGRDPLPQAHVLTREPLATP